MKKQRGSALIIAVFLMSAIGSAAFGVGRLIYLQIASANAYEKGIYAYYAAESGIEEGFLRYRYDQETTIPFDNPNFVDNENVYRNNLTLKTTNAAANPAGISPLDIVNTVTNQVYDLRINPYVEFYGEDINKNNLPDDIGDANYANGKPEYGIVRDESKKFKVDLSNLKDLKFYFRPMPDSALSTSPAPLSDQNCVLVEVKIVAKTNPASDLEEHKKMFKNVNSSLCSYDSIVSPADTETVGTYNQDGSAVPIYSIDSLKNVWSGHNAIIGEAELFIKPIGASLVFLIDPINTTPKTIYGPSTKISSSGYYMGIRRELEADIDRQSGTLYDLFDYVIYKAQ